MGKRRLEDASSSAPQIVQREIRAPKKTKVTHETLVDRVNALNTTDFAGAYVDGASLDYMPRDMDTLFGIRLTSASELNSIDFDACYKLVESTSRPDYEASTQGWHPRNKAREMKDQDMRYLLVHQNREVVESLELEGFLSFMITHDSTPSVPVLYIYEIHLSNALRGLGLGAHLMSLVEDIARRVGVEKVMLTCFLSNETALNFYKKRGFVTDACSPEDRKTRKKTVKADYVIMSKVIDSAKISQSGSAEADNRDSVRAHPWRATRTKSELRLGDSRAPPHNVRAWISDVERHPGFKQWAEASLKARMNADWRHRDEAFVPISSLAEIGLTKREVNAYDAVASRCCLSVAKVCNEAEKFQKVGRAGPLGAIRATVRAELLVLEFEKCVRDLLPYTPRGGEWVSGEGSGEESSEGEDDEDDEDALSEAQFDEGAYSE